MKFNDSALILIGLVFTSACVSSVSSLGCTFQSAREYKIEMAESLAECQQICKGYGEDWKTNPERKYYTGAGIFYDCNCYTCSVSSQKTSTPTPNIVIKQLPTPSIITGGSSNGSTAPQKTPIVISPTIESAKEYTPDSNTAALWHFNDDDEVLAKDSSGNNNDGTIVGATYVEGKFGKALEFNNGYVVVQDSASLNFGEKDSFTLEAWIYPFSTNNRGRIIAKNALSSDLEGYQLHFFGDRGTLFFQAGGEFVEFVNSEIALNTWSHVAAVYDSSSKQFVLYLNGIEKAKKNISKFPISTTGSLRIGAKSGGGDHFSGRIDEVRISNKARSISDFGLSS